MEEPGTRDDETLRFDDQFREIMRRGASMADGSEVDDHIEALLQSGPLINSENQPENEATQPFSFTSPRFEWEKTDNSPPDPAPFPDDIIGSGPDIGMASPNAGAPADGAAFSSPAPGENAAGDLPGVPDDKKTPQAPVPPQDDFLRMFPGSKG
jgi:hypothetical protein